MTHPSTVPAHDTFHQLFGPVASPGMVGRTS
jgi:hypothetical protein